MNALYVHVPFCSSKCPYCDFYSVEKNSPSRAGYASLLVRHLNLEVEMGNVAGPFSTVFFGGGTPSLLSPDEIGEVLEAAGNLFGFAPDAEISMEANPGTVSRRSLAGYREAGVNRLSLGVQSLSNRMLGTLGRGHSPEQAKAALAWAREAGFESLGLDLMFGLPGQGRQELELELDGVLELDVDHVSIYGLTVEEGTPFFHRRREGGLILPDEEACAEMYRRIDERLEGEGIAHYEISNFARPGFECRHNMRYWRRLPYLGVGAGAHSFSERGWGERRSVPPDLDLYAKNLEAGIDPSEFIESFDRRGAMAETVYLGLRTAAGVDEEAFSARFGQSVAEAFPEAVLAAGERLRLEKGCWRFDLSGWLLYDHLIAAFL